MIFIICVIFDQPAAAQIEQSYRFEINLANSEAPFDVTTADQNGLFLNRYLFLPDKEVIEVIRLDTTFQKVWGGYVSLEKGLTPVTKKSNESSLYFLLKHQNSKDFELLKINQQNGEYVRFPIKSFIPFNVTELQVTSDAVLIGGYFNRVPLVLYFNFTTLTSKLLPGLFNEEGELTQIKVFKDDTFQVLINARNYEKQKTIWLKNYSTDGTLISNLMLHPEDKKNLLFGRSVRTSNGMEVVAGTYGNRNNEYARGLFIATIDPNGLQQLKYYNFGDLQNFFKYLKAKRESRIKERIARRKVKGKRIRFNYRFLVDEVIEHNGEYMMLGEAFYPQYRSMSSSSYNGFFQPYSNFSRSYIRGDQIFDGYRYTHAVIIGFDKDGKILWDNSFEINDVKTFTLEQYVRMEPEKDKITLIYLFENQIRTKIIKDSNMLEEKLVDPIKTRFETDVLLSEMGDKNQMNYWYDKYFYAYGIQNIVNVSSPEVPSKRRVFFINKIHYD